jgi:UV excision repair protein RAD23
MYSCISGAGIMQVLTRLFVHTGKILADDKTVESCDFKEKDFIVLMTSKVSSCLHNVRSHSLSVAPPS